MSLPGTGPLAHANLGEAPKLAHPEAYKVDGPDVSVYVPCHNYGRFLRTAVLSVFAQTHQSWELLVVDDGSEDETSAVIDYLPPDPRIRTFENATAKGLRGVANQCFKLARGRFVMRLDADDWLHARALELLLRECESDPDLAIVFPDYFYADRHGRVIGVEALPRAAGEYRATSFPPHGAGSLIRLDLVRELGGLDTTLRRQDGHEIWLRILDRGGRMRHVDIPLFYYRQHGSSLTSDEGAVLADRAQIKRTLVGKRRAGDHVIGVLTACNTNPVMPDVPFARVDGEALLDRLLVHAGRVAGLDRIVVTTDCPRVVAHVHQGGWPVTTVLRDAQLRHHEAEMREILVEVVDRLGLGPATVLCVLNLHSLHLTARHVDDALACFTLYDVDSVVSVYEERNLVYQLGPHGLEPLNPSWQYLLRREREAVYIDNAAIKVFRVANLQEARYLGIRVGHVLMSRHDSFRLNNPLDLRWVEQAVPEPAALLWNRTGNR